MKMYMFSFLLLVTGTIVAGQGVSDGFNGFLWGTQKVKMQSQYDYEGSFLSSAVCQGLSSCHAKFEFVKGIEVFYPTLKFINGQFYSVRFSILEESEVFLEKLIESFGEPTSVKADSSYRVIDYSEEDEKSHEKSQWIEYLWDNGVTRRIFCYRTTYAEGWIYEPLDSLEPAPTGDRFAVFSIKLKLVTDSCNHYARLDYKRMKAEKEEEMKKSKDADF